MTTDRRYPVPEERAADAHIDAEKYAQMYEHSIKDPDAFWAEQAESFIDWFKPWETVSHTDYHTGHQTAIIWEGDDPSESRHITYTELHGEVCRFASALKGIGVKKGDRVCLYMPMIPEAAIAMLACTRIGAIHSIVFGGFSPDALKDRINDSACSVVITADQGLRGGRKVPLKSNVDKACEKTDSVKRVVVVQRGGEEVEWTEGRDLWYHELIQGASENCPAVEMNSEDPLFILYTSGSTGTPKGVLHTSGGYILYASMTHKYVFDYQDGDVYWCTADVGWVTGHSYIVYGPLANGATTLMFEGVPTYPIWEVIDKHKVNTFYTAPTAIRALMSQGDEPVTSTDRSSLRILGSVGEPINPEAWAHAALSSIPGGKQKLAAS